MLQVGDVDNIRHGTMPQRQMIGKYTLKTDYQQHFCNKIVIYQSFCHHSNNKATSAATTYHGAWKPIFHAP